MDAALVITFTDGNFWLLPVDVQVNTVNVVGVMGKGIALEFKTRYPEMFKEYVRVCRDNQIQPGGIHVWENRVINVATKDHWRDPSKYEWIEAGCQAIADWLGKQEKILKVACPAMGCANGGLNFSMIASIMSDAWGNLPHQIVVFKPQ